MKISIIIATWNRRDALATSLSKLSALDYGDYEIILVDNASVDGTAELVSGFSRVKLVSLEKNCGASAYNAGLKIASGECVVFMDNDAYLKNDALSRLSRRFTDEPDLSAISMNIVIDGTGSSETFDWMPDTPNIHGAGFAVRKNVLESVGGYDKMYFLVHTDLELATRILNSGYKIAYDKDIICFHMRSDKARMSGMRLFFSTRNALFYYWKYFPVLNAVVLSGREAVYGFSRSVRERSLLGFLGGFLAGFLYIPYILTKRTPLDKELYKRLKLYIDKSFRQPVFRKIIKR